MENSDIKLKGTKDGVDIYLDTRLETEELYKTYTEFLKEKKDFFGETRLTTVKLVGNHFSEEQKTKLKDITKEYVDCANVDYMTMDDFRSHPLVRKEEQKRPLRRRRGQEQEPSRACHKEMDVPTRYVDGTVRSGDTVEYDGNIVVMGDVNAGAIIKATGSVYVLGTLRGTAHAGIDGDETAFIYALCMAPLQIRIANNIAKSPDGKPKLVFRPEIAKISGEYITVESAINI